MMADVVTLQAALEKTSFDLVASIDQNPNQNLTAAYLANADSVVSAFWKMPDMLIQKYVGNRTWGVIAPIAHLRPARSQHTG